MITWRESMEPSIDGRRRFGNKLTVKDVKAVPPRTQRDAGHTQFVTIMEDPKATFEGDWEQASYFSGAYFRHLAPWER